MTLTGAWASAAAPPPKLTVSQWADLRRRLPETSGARGGLWRTAATPYLRGIMDSVHEIGVEQIAFEKAAQVGGSEALNNIIGYHIEYDPCPILLVQPTQNVAEEFSKDRLADMLRSTPELEALVSGDKQPGARAKQVDSTLSLKMFPGGYLVLGGANTPNTFARRSVRLAIGDDVDRFPAVVGEEGDPADLLVKRTTTFHDGISIFVSTPTLKGGRIDTLYNRSDRRRFFVACLVCGHEDWITWSGSCGVDDCNAVHFRVGFDERDPPTARIECPNCEAHLDEPARRQMIMEAAERDDGGWRPTAVAQQPGLVGFNLPAMLSTLGKVTLPSLVSDFLNAQGKGKESLRVFINTTLAEGWRDQSVRLQPSLLMQRREQYGPTGVEIPSWVGALTAGVDVQIDRFELLVMGWGRADERAVIDWHTIPGDPKRAETRAALLEALGRKYAHALGPMLPIHATCIDSGWATDQIYDFVLAYQARRIYATKGIAGRQGTAIVGKPTEARRDGRRPVRVYPINVDDGKADVMNSLSLKMPAMTEPGQSWGPGCIHFPLHVDTVNEEFFAQLCSEHREQRRNKNGVITHEVWVPDRERNEALDTAVMCLAAYRLLNPNIPQRLEAIKNAGMQMVESERAPDPNQQTPQADVHRPRERQVARSKYLGG